MNAQLNSDVVALNARVQQFISQPRKVLIDGRWVPAKTGKTFDVSIRPPGSALPMSRHAMRRMSTPR